MAICFQTCILSFFYSIWFAVSQDQMKQAIIFLGIFVILLNTFIHYFSLRNLMDAMDIPVLLLRYFWGALKIWRMQKVINWNLPEFLTNTAMELCKDFQHSQFIKVLKSILGNCKRRLSIREFMTMQQSLEMSCFFKIIVSH